MIAVNTANTMNTMNPMNAMNTMNAVHARGRLLTTKRQGKVARPSRSINDESNFGDSGYEVTV